MDDPDKPVVIPPPKPAQPVQVASMAIGQAMNLRPPVPVEMQPTKQPDFEMPGDPIVNLKKSKPRRDRHAVAEPARRKSQNRPLELRNQVDAAFDAMASLSKAELTALTIIRGTIAALPGPKRRRVLGTLARMFGVVT